MRPPRRDDAITIPVAPLRRLLTIVVVLVVLGGLAIFALAQRDSIRAAFGGAEASYIDNTTYQSVVLTTNQVYFGKLRIDGDVYVLTEVYSLATVHVPVPGLATPYTVVLAELGDTGVRTLVRLTGAPPGSVAIGDRGRMVFRRVAVRMGVPDYGYAFLPVANAGKVAA